MDGLGFSTGGGGDANVVGIRVGWIGLEDLVKIGILDIYYIEYIFFYGFLRLKIVSVWCIE